MTITNSEMSTVAKKIKAFCTKRLLNYKIYCIILLRNAYEKLYGKKHKQEDVNGKYFSINFGNYFSIITGILFSIFFNPPRTDPWECCLLKW